MQLILAIPTVVSLSLYMLGGKRTGICRVLVYLLLHGIPSEYRAVLYTVGKVFSRRLRRRWDHEKRFRTQGEITGTRWLGRTLGGRVLQSSCLGLLATWDATNGYLGCWRIVWQKGNWLFHSTLMRKYRKSRIMIWLLLISLISLLLPYGFRSTLVPTERSYRGESNAVGCRKLGEELVKDVGNYSEMNCGAWIRNIGAFLFRLVVHWAFPLRVKHSPSILSHFWSGLECFRGQKGGSTSITSRVWVFVYWKSCRRIDEWW